MPQVIHELSANGILGMTATNVLGEQGIQQGDCTRGSMQGFPALVRML